MNYQKVLAFYKTLMAIIDCENEAFPISLATVALELHKIVKQGISVKEFTMQDAKELHAEHDIREDYAEKAFQDLAPHLRDPEALKLIYRFIDRSGTSSTDDLYLHVKNVRPLDPACVDGPAVVTLIVDSFSVFKALVLKKDAPDYIHGSISEEAALSE